MIDVSSEDAKLIQLARQARVRIGAAEGAAVRDETGRSFSGATLALPALSLTALELAVAQACTSGATDFEGAVVVTSGQSVNVEALSQAATTPTRVLVCSIDGQVTNVVDALAKG